MVNKIYPFSNLIIIHFHKQNFHVERKQFAQSYRYTLVKVIINDYFYCKREREKPLMRSIQTGRLCTNEKSCTKIEVDYMEPYQIKLSKRTITNEATEKC